MTTRDPLGLTFTDLPTYLSLPTFLILRLLTETQRNLDRKFAANPSSRYRSVPDEVAWYTTYQGVEYMFAVQPESRNMQWGHIYDVVGLLGEWAGVYKAGEVSFEIWKSPGSGAQSEMLGHGHFLMSF